MSGDLPPTPPVTAIPSGQVPMTADVSLPTRSPSLPTQSPAISTHFRSGTGTSIMKQTRSTENKIKERNSVAIIENAYIGYRNRQVSMSVRVFVSPQLRCLYRRVCSCPPSTSMFLLLCVWLSPLNLDVSFVVCVVVSIRS